MPHQPKSPAADAFRQRKDFIESFLGRHLVFTPMADLLGSNPSSTSEIAKAPPSVQKESVDDREFLASIGVPLDNTATSTDWIPSCASSHSSSASSPVRPVLPAATNNYTRITGSGTGSKPTVEDASMLLALNIQPRRQQHPTPAPAIHIPTPIRRTICRLRT